MATQPDPLTRDYDHLHRAESRSDLDNSDMLSTWEPTLPGGETPRRSDGPSLEAKTATRPVRPTFEDLKALLRSAGIDVCTVKAMEIVVESFSRSDSPLFLQVTRFLLDGEGKRFAVRLPDGDLEVATERVLIPMTALPALGE